MLALCKSRLRFSACLAALFSFSVAFALPTSSNQQEIFGTKSSSDGPVTICSDSLTYDQKSNEMTYIGNVLVMQVKSVGILCHKGDKPEGGTSSSASLWVDDSGKSYYDLQNEELSKAKEICAKEKACRFLSGQKLQVFLDENNHLKRVMLTADKSEEHVAKFYGLSEKDGKNDKPDETLAQGQTMEFLPMEQKMIVSGNAHIVKDGNVFDGKQVIYDTKTKLVTVPNSGQRASVVINSDGTLSSEGDK